MRGGQVHGRAGMDAALRDAGCLLHDPDWVAAAAARERREAVEAAEAAEVRRSTGTSPRRSSVFAMPSMAVPMEQLVRRQSTFALLPKLARRPSRFPEKYGHVARPFTRRALDRLQIAAAARGFDMQSFKTRRHGGLIPG